jgi:hypothetical protein
MGEYADAYIDRMFEYHSFNVRSRERKRPLNMADKIIVVRGEASWAKVLGPARPYEGNPKFDKGPYWSIDITPDKKSREIIKAVGIADKLRAPKGEKETRKESYLTLKMNKLKADGTPNLDNSGKQIVPKVETVDGRAWPQEELLGNGTVVDIKIKVKDYGTTTGAYMQAIRVLKLVPYGGGGFAPLSEDDEFFGGAAGTDDAMAVSGDSNGPIHDADLDDDVPF